MGLFSKKKQTNPVVQTAEKLILEQIKNDDDVYITGLATSMMEGSPLILNFDGLHIDRANKVISFITGVVFAIKGEILEINETTYLFGNSEVYKDGSIEEWLKSNIN